GCDLPEDPSKISCSVAEDCLDGYVCHEQRCIIGGAVDLGTDLENHPSDFSPAPPDASSPRGSWQARFGMPTPRQEHALVASPDGRLFAIGGLSRGDVIATVEVYTPSADSWTAVQSMQTARYGFGAALGADGRIYVMGGQYGSVNDDGASRLAEVYDVEHDA